MKGFFFFLKMSTSMKHKSKIDFDHFSLKMKSHVPFKLQQLYTISCDFSLLRCIYFDVTGFLEMFSPQSLAIFSIDQAITNRSM